MKIWSRGSGGASVWLPMIALLALFWLYSWLWWYDTWFPMLKFMDESCLLIDEEYSLLRWKSYNSEIRAAHAEIAANYLLMNVFRLHKLRWSTDLGGAAGWILMIALLEIWLLILWLLWYSYSNDDGLVHGLWWWDVEWAVFTACWSLSVGWNWKSSSCRACYYG